MTEPREKERPAKPHHVLARQRASLERLAARAGITRHGLELLTQRDAVNDLSHLSAQSGAVVDHFGSFAGLSKQDFRDFASREVQAYEFWTDLARREYYTHSVAVDAIAKICGHLPINWAYIKDLARHHGLPVPSDQPDEMRAFLGQIPCAYLFDHEFNAFIEWNRESIVPCVFYNTLLLDSLTEVAQLVSLFFDTHRSHAGLTTDDVCSRTRVMVDRLVGRQLLVRNPAIIEAPGAFLGTLGMALSAHMFVAAHELAHLLLGHDGGKSSLQAEHEADMFATLALGSAQWPNRECAIVPVFALIDIVEADRPPGGSHPRPHDRVSVVGMQAAAAKAKIDWNYVCGLLKAVLDDAAEGSVGRRVFQDCEVPNLPGERGRRIELRRPRQDI